MAHKLTQGAIQTIMSGGEVTSPILQILGSKKITGSGSIDRYRLLISDGVHLNSFAMLATQLNDKISNGELSEKSIVKINRHVVSMVNNQGKGDKRVMIILDVTPLQRGEEVGATIGNPVPYDGSNNQTSTPASNTAAPSSTANSSYPSANNNKLANNFGGKGNMANFNNAAASPMGGQRSHPIACLSPYQNKWVIKARVTSKTAIRTWSNARGEGKLFSLDLLDESGEIRLTLFKDQVDQFYDMIEPNKLYFISKCQIKQANKKFSGLNNEYEMTATSDTRIEPCNDDDDGIPNLKYNFVNLNAIQNTPADTIIDVIGICQKAGDVVTLMQRTTNKELKKRDVVLVDNSLCSVNLTLWGSEAESFDPVGQPVVALKQGKISEFGGGKSINILGNSLLQLNPDIPEAHKLRGWFDGLTPDAQFNSISARGGGSEGYGSQFTTIKELKSSPPAMDKAEYFSVSAFIMHIRQENFCYKACPQPDCNKKVIDQNTMLYRCEKCNREFDNFKYRLILNLQMADMTDATWVTCFQDSAELLLERTANEVGSISESENASLIEEIFQTPVFNFYNFKLRSKMETYNDESRRKIQVISANRADKKDYAQRLISEIKKLAGITTKA